MSDPATSEPAIASSTDLPRNTSAPIRDDAPAPASEKARGKRPQRRREDESEDVKISKTLSYILRHGAAKEGLKMRPDGYIRVDELLKRPKLKGVDVPTIRKIVADNNKQRYALTEEADPEKPGDTILLIRANQGHSLAVEDLELTKLEKPEDCPVVVHGTFTKHWETIRKEGLKVMGRHHIHCASGLFGEEGVTSGMRASCDLFIYIDVGSAMADGIVFEKSANGVILTNGKDGVLQPNYFREVKNKKGESISIENGHVAIR